MRLGRPLVLLGLNVFKLWVRHIELVALVVPHVHLRGPLILREFLVQVIVRLYGNVVARPRRHDKPHARQ